MSINTILIAPPRVQTVNIGPPQGTTLPSKSSIYAQENHNTVSAAIGITFGVIGFFILLCIVSCCVRRSKSKKSSGDIEKNGRGGFQYYGPSQDVVYVGTTRTGRIHLQNPLPYTTANSLGAVCNHGEDDHNGEIVRDTTGHCVTRCVAEIDGSDSSRISYFYGPGDCNCQDGNNGICVFPPQHPGGPCVSGCGVFIVKPLSPEPRIVELPPSRPLTPKNPNQAPGCPPVIINNLQPDPQIRERLQDYDKQFRKDDEQLRDHREQFSRHEENLWDHDVQVRGLDEQLRGQGKQLAKHEQFLRRHAWQQNEIQGQVNRPDNEFERLDRRMQWSPFDASDSIYNGCNNFLSGPQNSGGDCDGSGSSDDNSRRRAGTISGSENIAQEQPQFYSIQQDVPNQSRRHSRISGQHQNPGRTPRVSPQIGLSPRQHRPDNRQASGYRSTFDNGVPRTRPHLPHSRSSTSERIPWNVHQNHVNYLPRDASFGARNRGPLHRAQPIRSHYSGAARSYRIDPGNMRGRRPEGASNTQHRIRTRRERERELDDSGLDSTAIERSATARGNFVHGTQHYGHFSARERARRHMRPGRGGRAASGLFGTRPGLNRDPLDHERRYNDTSLYPGMDTEQPGGRRAFSA